MIHCSTDLISLVHCGSFLYLEGRLKYPTGCATRCEQANDGWKSHITRHSDHLVCLLVMWEKLCFRRPSLNAPKQGPEPLGLRSVSRCATRGHMRQSISNRLPQGSGGNTCPPSDPLL